MLRSAFFASAVAFSLITAAVPQVVDISPSVVPLGHDTQVDIKVQDARPGLRIALSPGGPFISARIPAAESVDLYAIPESDRIVHVSTHEVTLLNGTTDPPEIISRAILDSSIAQAAFFGSTALLADDRNAVFLAQLPDADHVALQPLYVFDRAVRAVALAGSRAIALLDDGTLWRAEVNASPPVWSSLGSTDPELERLTFDGTHCLLYAPKMELHIFECAGNELREISRFRTSGEIADAILGAGLAILANSDAGLTLLNISNPAEVRLAGSYNKLGRAIRVAADHDRVLVANDHGDITLLDISRPELPLLVSRLKTNEVPRGITLRDDIAWSAGPQFTSRLDFTAEPASLLSDEGLSLGGSRRGFIRNNTLYVADWFSGLHLYDVSNPESIRHIGNYHSPGSSKGVVVRDRYAFVGDDDHGVQIVDISDAEHPKPVKNVPTTGLAYTMKLVGDRLYVADHRGGLHIIDVHNIPTAQVIGSFDTPGKAWAVDVRDTTAFVADDSSGLLIFDTSDPKHIRQIGQFSPGGQAEDVRLRDRYAFVTFFDQGLFVIDTLDPTNPREVAHLDIPGNARGIDFQGTYAFIAAWEAGLQIVDLRDPRHPKRVAYADTDGSAWGVNVSGSSAYVLDWWGGVKRVDIQDPTQPHLSNQYQARAEISQVALGHGCAATVDGSGSVQIYDATNGLNPIWINGIDLVEPAQAIGWHGDTAYVAAGNSIAALDMRDPFTARRSTTVPTPWRPVQLRASGNRLVAISDSGIAATVDSTTGELRTITTGVHDAWIADNTLFVARGTLGLAAYSLDGMPLNTKTSWMSAIGNVRLIRVGERAAALVDGKSSLRFATRNETSFTEVSGLDLESEINDVVVLKDQALVTTAENQLVAIDLHDVSRPFVTHRYSSAQRVTQFAVGDGFAFFGGERKLSSLKLLPVIQFLPSSPGVFSAKLPASLPQGAYDITVSDNQRSFPSLHNAIRVSIKTGRKPAMSPERFQELLNQQRR